MQNSARQRQIKKSLEVSERLVIKADEGGLGVSSIANLITCYIGKVKTRLKVIWTPNKDIG